MKWERIRKIGRRVFFVLIVFGAAGFLAAAGTLVYVSGQVPTPGEFDSRSVPESTLIYDRNGEFLYELHGDIKRIRIGYEEMPRLLKQAVIAVEDKDFYDHFGFDLTAIARAFKTNLEEGEIEQGASTITQQLARNVSLGREKTLSRKLKELVLAVKIESRYSKDEILHMYLNEIPFGSNAYGIQAASQVYFAKDARDLTLMEAAYLASLPKAPTYFSPFGPNKQELNRRAARVLGLMEEQGFISAEEREAALGEDIVFERAPAQIRAPHFVFYVQDYLARRFGEEQARRGGMRVYTTLDLALQQTAQEIVSRRAAGNERAWGADNAALSAVDPRTGQILAMVGSRDYFDEEHDGEVNVTTRPRQPGSSFKPYVYATAFAEGMNPATMLIDARTNFASDNGNKTYIPRNYSGSWRGPVSIRQALAGSLNIPAVKTLVLVGIDDAIDTAESMGITTLTNRGRYGPALVLGGGEVTLLEHTAAMGVFGAGGVKRDLSPVLRILDSQGEIIYEAEAAPPERQAVDPQVAYLINDILSDNVARTFVFGRGNRLAIAGHKVAVKTGTTQEFRDGWTVGYTPRIAVGVWAGNNDNSPMRAGADGSVVAAPIWNEFMSHYLADKTPQEFERPAGIVELAVDRLSGKLPTILTPSTKTEIFASFNVPTQRDDVHIGVEIGGEYRVITRLYAEKPDDPLWSAGVRAAALAAGYSYGSPGEIALEERREYEEEKRLFGLGGGEAQVAALTPAEVSEELWEIVIRSQPALDIKKVDLFLGNTLLMSHGTGNFSYATDYWPGAGGHMFTAKYYTGSGNVFEQKRYIEFVSETPTSPDLLGQRAVN